MPTATALSVKPIPQRYSMGWLASLMALACSAVGLALSLHYPLAQPVMTGLFVVCIAVFYIWPNSWLVAVPAMLPVIGLAPWTGWLTFEEFDLLVLAAAAAGYARLALRMPLANSKAKPAERNTPGYRSGMSAPALLLSTLFLVSVLVAMFRGFLDAGGFSFGEFQGYHEPMNSVRLAKSFLLAVLLVPLWRTSIDQATPQGTRLENTSSLLAAGLLIGVAGTSLAAIWERVAFPGLLNFSSDYRTTAMFWEMHVGGAALDGFLALSVPFAAHVLLHARTPVRWVAAATVLILAGYACLTSFSRGVYLAVPIGLAIMLGLHALNQQRSRRPTGDRGSHPSRYEGFLPGLLLTIGFGMGAGWIFATGGYRSVIALWGALAVFLPLVSATGQLKLSDWLLGLLLGGVLSALAIIGSMLLSKGAYAVYGLSLAFSAVMLYQPPKMANRRATLMALAGFLCVLTSAGLVAEHWGGPAALNDLLPVLAILFVVALLSAKSTPSAWPRGLRWQLTVLVAMLMAAAVVAVFAGGSYMTTRFSSSEKDYKGRETHWQQGLAMLATPLDWALGKGLGRFPDNYFFASSTTEHPGDYRLATERGNTYLTLTGGQQPASWGNMLRMSQRIDVPLAPVKVNFSVRAEKPVNLHFEVCEKHLLYDNSSCLTKKVGIQPRPGEWQQVQLLLDGKSISRGDWYAPRPIVFSFAIESRAGLANIDNLSLVDLDGQNLLVNGDFSASLEHWFFSSDRNHMPWHIKSLFMNVLFDQGLVGLVILASMGVAVLWRVTMGRGRTHALSPAVAGALVGFAVVGLFDSLLDVPRVAFLFYFLLLVGLVIRSPNRIVHETLPGSSNRASQS